MPKAPQDKFMKLAQELASFGEQDQARIAAVAKQLGQGSRPIIKLPKQTIPQQSMVDAPKPQKRRGRKKGSKNKPKEVTPDPGQHPSGIQ